MCDPLWSSGKACQRVENRNLEGLRDLLRMLHVGRDRAGLEPWRAELQIPGFGYYPTFHLQLNSVSLYGAMFSTAPRALGLSSLPLFPQQLRPHCVLDLPHIPLGGGVGPNSGESLLCPQLWGIPAVPPSSHYSHEPISKFGWCSQDSCWPGQVLASTKRGRLNFLSLVSQTMAGLFLTLKVKWGS